MRLTATRTSVTSAGGAGDALYRAAGGRPTLDQRFAKDKALVDKISGNNLITFSRASSGTYVDSDGLIKTAVADAPRFDHDPVTGESLGLLIEEERTNLAKYSEPDDRSTNNVSGEWRFANLDPNTEITKVEGPDGVSNSASEMQLATGNSYDAYLHQVPVTSGASYTFSAWIKLGTATNFALHVNDTTDYDSVPDGRYSFDVNDGLNTNTFVKVSHKFTAPSNGKVNVHIGRHGGTAPAQQTQGTVTVWGCQVELGAFSSSTIITSGSTVTRSPDLATIEGTNFSSWYNQSEGTFVTISSSVSNLESTENRGIFQITDQTLAASFYRQLVLYRGTSKAFFFASKDNNANSFNPTNAGDPSYDNDTLAYGYSSSEISKVFYDGSQVSSTPSIVDWSTYNSDRLTVGSGGGTDLNGHISRLAYFPTLKTDQELVNITS